MSSLLALITSMIAYLIIGNVVQYFSITFEQGLLLIFNQFTVQATENRYRQIRF